MASIRRNLDAALDMQNAKETVYHTLFHGLQIRGDFKRRVSLLLHLIDRNSRRDLGQSEGSVLAVNLKDTLRAIVSILPPPPLREGCPTYKVGYDSADNSSSRQWKAAVLDNLG
jgi:hypothetical protein